MDVRLVEEITAADCWEGPVVAALRCTVLPRSGAAESAPAVLLVTRTMFYLLEQVAPDDAAVVAEDLVDAICGCRAVRDGPADNSVSPARLGAFELDTVDGDVLALRPVPGASGAVSFDQARLFELFPSARPEDHVPAFRTPVPPTPGALSPSGSMLTPEPPDFESAMRVAEEAAALTRELQVERHRTSSMADRATLQSAVHAIELEEATSRQQILVEEHDVAWAIVHAMAVSWRQAVRADAFANVEAIKKLHCSTHRLENVLPDGAALGNLHEVPVNREVAALLEQTERAARSSLGSFLTTEQLKSRERRHKLEVDMATRDLRFEVAKKSRSISDLKAELSAVRNKASDLESSCIAMNGKIAEYRQREQSVLERARQREDELHAQIALLTQQGGAGRSGGRDGNAGSRTGPAVFDW